MLCMQYFYLICVPIRFLLFSINLSRDWLVGTSLKLPTVFLVVNINSLDLICLSGFIVMFL